MKAHLQRVLIVGPSGSGKTVFARQLADLLALRVDNIRAKGLYERAGFAVEGLCRNHMRIDGKHYDSYLMAILFA